MVFYERGATAKNPGFIEIKDKEFLAKLKNDYV
jgi:hypothetical protein